MDSFVLIVMLIGYGIMFHKTSIEEARAKQVALQMKAKFEKALEPNDDPNSPKAARAFERYLDAENERWSHQFDLYLYLLFILVALFFLMDDIFHWL